MKIYVCFLIRYDRDRQREGDVMTEREKERPNKKIGARETQTEKKENEENRITTLTRILMANFLKFFLSFFFNISSSQPESSRICIRIHTYIHIFTSSRANVHINAHCLSRHLSRVTCIFLFFAVFVRSF